MSFEEMVAWLMTPAAAALFGGLLWSVVLAFIPAFNDKSEKFKQWGYTLSALVIATLAVVVNIAASCSNMPGATLICSGDFWEYVTLFWWPVVYATGATFGIGTLFYANVVKPVKDKYFTN